MVGFGLEDEVAGLVGDAVGEVEADAFGVGGPELDGQQVVIAGGGFVAEATFDDGENGVLVLPVEKGGAEVAEEFAAGGFEEVEVAGVVYMVANGAVGVTDAVLVVKLVGVHGGILWGEARRGKVLVLPHGSSRARGDEWLANRPVRMQL
ncbi:MAG: hypothetical protein JWR19_4236 [Pedosphaera sp.]|nr:hypothetical protein [Pedosphaera sp.]